MVQVGKLDETIKYYKENFGMEQLRYRDVPDVRSWPADGFGWQGALQPDVSQANILSAGSLALSWAAACCTAC